MMTTMKKSKTSTRPLPPAHDNDDDNDADDGTVVEVPPNRQTYNIMIQSFAGANQPAIAEAILEKMRAEGGYKKPDVDLFTVTVAADERTQQPFKALSLMHRMEKYEYLFCNVAVLTAFR
jgi:pentatricopeptide repeat protein